jgi:dolichol-phosphate mannosyltransferase
VAPQDWWPGGWWLVLQCAVLATMLRTTWMAARAERPLHGGDGDDAAGRISVVVPARNEAARIAGCLAPLRDAPGVVEVLVVDDESTDGTADVARSHGATVLAGAPLPAGWVGKAWALHQGASAARGEWVVTLDADAIPDPRLPGALVARLERDGVRVATAAGRFRCPTGPSRWLHAAMLTTLVVRFGPAGRRGGSPLANGQCMSMRRGDLVELLGEVRGSTVEDVALVAAATRRGWPTRLVDATSLLTVQMYDTLATTWRGWGRSLSLAGAVRPVALVWHLLLVAVAQVAPPVALAAAVVSGASIVHVAVPLALVAVRLGTLAGTRRAYERGGPWYWSSPLADVVAWCSLVAGVARRVLRRPERWRDRTYA